MELKEAIEKRRSIRHYEEKEAPLHVIGEILETARLAPSAGNAQNWRFIITMEKRKKLEIAEACLNQRWMAEASALIAVCNASKKLTSLYKEAGKRFSVQNCAIISSYIQLLAVEKGLGTCWVGAFDEGKLHHILGLPDDVSVEAVIAMGYPDEEKHPHVRNEFADLCYFEKWGGKEAPGIDFSLRRKARTGAEALKGLFLR